MNIEDLLYYADDILMICTSMEQVRECIQTVEKWSEQNGMLLNKKKSGIVVFGNRRCRNIPLMESTKTETTTKNKGKKVNIQWAPSQKEISGVPICQKYKYLGTYLDSKLTAGPQISHIKKKSGHIFAKLYPYLKNASADARRDMWQTMVAPLFNAALTLLKYEPSKAQQENLVRLWRCTFKQFMMISKRTSTNLIDEMIQKKLKEIADAENERSKIQWEARKDYREIPKNAKAARKPNLLRGLPNSWCRLINTQIRPCPKCKTKGTITSSWHLKYAHNQDVKHIQKIWKEELNPIVEKEEKRDIITTIMKSIIEKHLEEYNRAIQEICI